VHANCLLTFDCANTFNLNLRDNSLFAYFKIFLYAKFVSIGRFDLVEVVLDVMQMVQYFLGFPHSFELVLQMVQLFLGIQCIFELVLQMV